MTTEPTWPEGQLPLTTGGLVEHWSRLVPDRPYFICDDEHLTYAEAERASRELARSLVAIGVGRSSHVGLLMPSGVDFVVGWLATTRLGAVAVPISTFSTAAELRSIVRTADVDTLLATSAFRSHDYLDKLSSAFPLLPSSAAGPLEMTEAPVLRNVFVKGDTAADWPGERSWPALEDAGGRVDDELVTAMLSESVPADRMVIVHTSGSTSKPKGVIHQHGSLIRHLDTLNGIRGLRPGMRLFSNSPLFWIGGLGYNVVGVLVAGATLICSTATDAGETLDLIERERPEMVNGFAQTVAHLVTHPTFAERDFSSIRTGNLYPIMPDDVRPADPELRHNMLGMTETGSVCLMSADESDLPERYRGSFGKPIQGIETRIVDPDGDHECTVGEVGELWLRGPTLMEGYYRRERHDVFTRDGWFRTGDMFVVDDEGFHYFKGRRGDMIKTAGVNVSPREVESALAELFPTHGVLVLGVDDAERDQIVIGIVIAPEGTEVDEAAVQARLHETLSHYKVPRRILRLDEDEIPVLSSGKIDTLTLRSRLRDR